MAIRTEALRSPQQRLGLPNRTPEVAADATVYRFPTASVRRRAAAQRRRQDLLRSMVGIAVFVALLAGAAKVSAPPEVASRPSAPGSVIVQPGQTLWGIAQRYAAAGSDPRAYVDALEHDNHVDAALQAGSRLRLP